MDDGVNLLLLDC